MKLVVRQKVSGGLGVNGRFVAEQPVETVMDLEQELDHALRNLSAPVLVTLPNQNIVELWLHGQNGL